MILNKSIIFETINALIFLVVISSSSAKVVNQLSKNRRFKRAPACRIESFKITNCGVEVSRLKSTKIKTSFTSSKECNFKEKSYKFSIWMNDKYSITIKKTRGYVSTGEIIDKLKEKDEMLPFGSQNIKVQMNAKTVKNDEISKTSKTCTFYVRSEPPTVIIRGGMNRNVWSNRSFEVISQSVNNDLEVPSKKDLIYEWDCEPKLPFCNGEANAENKDRIEFPADLAVIGKEYVVKLNVRTSFLSNWTRAYQKIYVNESMSFNIECPQSDKNYPNFVRPFDGVNFRAYCSLDCSQYARNEIFGQLVTFEYKTLSMLGNIDVMPKRFIQVQNVKSESNFRALLNVMGKQGPIIIAEQVFHTFEAPNLENCTAVPPRGTPFIPIKFRCDYDKSNVDHFDLEVYDASKTSLYWLRNESLDNFETRLLYSAKGSIVIYDKNQTYNHATVPIEIDSEIPFNKNESKISQLNAILDGKSPLNNVSVAELIAQGKNNEAVQLMDLVTRQMSGLNASNPTDQKILDEMKRKLLDYVPEMHIEDYNVLKRVSEVMATMAANEKGKPLDPVLSKILTSNCGSLSEEQHEFIMNDFDSEITSKEIEKTTNNLFKCGEVDSKPEIESSNETTAVNYTTEFPILSNLSEETFENYPQYNFVEDILEDHAKDILDVADNYLEICRRSGQTSIFKLSSFFVRPKYLDNGQTCLGYFKADSTRLVNQTYHQQNLTVILPSFLTDMRSTLAIVMCSYKSNPYWAFSKTDNITTNVLDISLYDFDRRKLITDLSQGFINITFDNMAMRNKEKFQFLVKDPKGNDDRLPILEIKTKAEDTFFLEFFDIEPSDSFMIITSEMERPLIDKFIPENLVTRTVTSFFFENIDKYDKWIFIAMIPGGNMNKTKKYSIGVEAYTLRCNEWIKKSKAWKFGCRVASDSTIDNIECHCSHLSTLAGSTVYNDIKQNPENLPFEFKLVMPGCVHIHVAVCFIVIAYLLMLIFSTRKKKCLENEAIFLSDVPAENRHAYLVSIKTGRKVDAGTTSNIAIQIVGSEGVSQEHVVNFPDPLLNILQRNGEDHFVLATPVHLGEIEIIHIWFDCTGLSPSWYCERIRICDLQMKKWYLFKIRKWFRVDGKARVSYSVGKSSDLGEVRKDFSRGRALWLRFSSFGRLSSTLLDLTAKNDPPRFQIPKRLTVVLSIALTILTVVICFYGKPEFMERDMITEDCDFNFELKTIQIGLVGAFIVFLPHVFLIEGFKYPGAQYAETKATNKKYRQFAATSICWIIVVTNVVAQIHLLLIYGYRVIPPKSIHCIMSFVIGFLFYIFMLDYMFNLFLVVVRGGEKKIKLDFKKLLTNIENQRKYLYKMFGMYIYRPILVPLYEKMNRAEFKKKFIKFRQMRDVNWEAQDLILITVFLFLLFYMILTQRDTTFDVVANTHVKKLVIGYGDGETTLMEIGNFIEFEEYIEEYFLPSIQSYQWYDKYVSESPGLVSDAHNRYLGVVRLRQHRVGDESCKKIYLMEFINRTCRSAIYFFPEDYLNYTPVWESTTPDYFQSRLGSVWGYHKDAGNSYYGVSGFFSTGGYVAQLGRSIKNSLSNFKYLMHQRWIDHLTKALRLEFPIYNVNKNVFHFIEVILEKTPSGFIEKKALVRTSRVLVNYAKTSSLSKFSALFFVLIVFTLTTRTVIRLLKTKTWYKKDLWYLLDAILVVSSITWIFFYIYRSILLKVFVTQLEEKKNNEFVYYFSLENSEYALSSLIGLLLCFATLRLWKLLRFATIFRVVERTMFYSSKPLFFQMIFYYSCFFGYACIGRNFLGSGEENFSTLYKSFKTLWLISVGVLDIGDLNYDSNRHGLGYAFFSVFVTFYLLFNEMLVSVLIFNYLKAREFSFEEKVDYNMKDYTLDQILKASRFAKIWLRKSRLRAGGRKQTVTEMVTPKENKIRYRQSLLVDSKRMEAMASVAKCFLMKHQKGGMFDESDHSLMMRTVKNLTYSGEGRTEFFFRKRRRDELHIVDNRRLLMMEQIVNSMVLSREEKSEKMKKKSESLLRDIQSKMERMNDQLKAMQDVVGHIEIRVLSRDD